MKRTFAYGAATCQGQWPVQEDGFFVDPVRGLFVLSDGFGGRGNGDIAAKTVLQEISAAPAATPEPREGSMHSPAQLWQRELFAEANRKLLAWNEKRPLPGRGGCSLLLVSADRAREELTLTQCGACSALLLRAGRWIPLLTPQAVPRTDSTQPLLPSQALGIGRDLVLESRSVAWQSGDIYILLSSGLAWAGDAAVAEFQAHLALRSVGGDLSQVVAFLAEGGLGSWNQTALALEIF